MSTGPRDVVIVGGGIVGCLSGYLLAKRGVKATVVEADSLGSHASGFAFGGLDPLHGAGLPEPLLDFSLWCYGRHQSLAQELQEATSAEVYFEAQDRLYLCFDDAEAQTAKKGLEWMQGLSGFSCQWLDETASLDAEPLINPDCIGTVHQHRARDPWSPTGWSWPQWAQGSDWGWRCSTGGQSDWSPTAPVALVSLCKTDG